MNRSRGERGAFVVFTAFLLMFMMAFVAFAVDFGIYYRHSSRLQSAADAAALAGISKYAEDLGSRSTARLVKLPTFKKDDTSRFEVTIGDKQYTFTRLTSVPVGVSEFATDYKKADSDGSGADMDDSLWQWTSEPEITQTDSGATKITTTTTDERCAYRVVLSDTVDTVFARIFGVNTLPLNVSAMAMLKGQDVDVVEELLPKISGNLNDIIPNYYWETIVEKDKTGTVTDSEHIDAATGEIVPETTYKTRYYGPNNRYYLTSAEQVETSPSYEGWPKSFQDATGGRIIGFKDSADGICADPIRADPSVADSALKTYVKTLQYNIEDSFIQQNGEDIIGLFLDRDNIANNGAGTWAGGRQRFTEINIGNTRGNNPNIPIYIRIESEPIQIGTNGLTTAHGVEINVTGTQEKPVVLTYDGPDPNRVETDAPSLPILPTIIRAWTESNTDKEPYVIYNGKKKQVQTFRTVNGKIVPIDAGRIMYEIEPLMKRYVPDDADLSTYNAAATPKTDPTKVPPPETMVLSSTKTPGPVYMNIPAGTVFNGAIYMPRSKIVIRGGGMINGFVAARRIELDGSFSNMVFITSQPISIPTLAAYRRNHSTDVNVKVFDYTKIYEEDNYNMVYSSFVDYTDTKYMP